MECFRAQLADVAPVLQSRYSLEAGLTHSQPRGVGIARDQESGLRSTAETAHGSGYGSKAIDLPGRSSSCRRSLAHRKTR